MKGNKPIVYEPGTFAILADFTQYDFEYHGGMSFIVYNRIKEEAYAVELEEKECTCDAFVFKKACKHLNLIDYLWRTKFQKNKNLKGRFKLGEKSF